MRLTCRVDHDSACASRANSVSLTSSDRSLPTSSASGPDPLSPASARRGVRSFIARRTRAATPTLAAVSRAVPAALRHRGFARRCACAWFSAILAESSSMMASRCRRAAWVRLLSHRSENRAPGRTASCAIAGRCFAARVIGPPRRRRTTRTVATATPTAPAAAPPISATRTTWPRTTTVRSRSVASVAPSCRRTLFYFSSSVICCFAHSTSSFNVWMV